MATWQMPHPSCLYILALVTNTGGAEKSRPTYGGRVQVMLRKKLAVVLAAVMMLGVMGVSPAQAESERIPIGPEPLVNPGLINPCTGEVVEITGEIRGFFQVVQTSTGETYTKVHTVVSGTGVGSEGNTYTFHEIHTQVIPGSPPFNETGQVLLISQGSGDSFALNQVVHVSPNGDVREIVAEPVCRG